MVVDLARIQLLVIDFPGDRQGCYRIWRRFFDFLPVLLYLLRRNGFFARRSRPRGRRGRVSRLPRPTFRSGCRGATGGGVGLARPRARRSRRSGCARGLGTNAYVPFRRLGGHQRRSGRGCISIRSANPSSSTKSRSSSSVPRASPRLAVRANEWISVTAPPPVLCCSRFRTAISASTSTAMATAPRSSSFSSANLDPVARTTVCRSSSMAAG